MTLLWVRCKRLLETAIEQQNHICNSVTLKQDTQIRTPQGEYVFLELNPNGQWLWLELKSGYHLTEDVTENLL